MGDQKTNRRAAAFLLFAYPQAYPKSLKAVNTLFVPSTGHEEKYMGLTTEQKATLEIIKRRLNTTSLPQELFAKTGKEAVMVALPATKMTGDWPKAPDHTCENGYTSGFILTAYDDYATLSPMPGRHWRECDGCYYHARVIRHAKQVESGYRYHDVFYWTHTANEADYKKLQARIRTHRKRYEQEITGQAYPQEDGSYYVIHNDDREAGELVPTDRGELFKILWSWLKTPEDKNVGPFSGWGWEYKGNKGDGRRKQDREQEKRPCVQLWSDDSIYRAAKSLDITLNSKHRGKCYLEPVDIWERLTKEGITFYTRSGKSAWDEFMTFILGDEPDPPTPKNNQEGKENEPTEPIYLASPLFEGVREC